MLNRIPKIDGGKKERGEEDNSMKISDGQVQY